MYLGATRSARTVGGVPASGFGMNLLVVFLGYMTGGNSDPTTWAGIVWPILGIVVYFVMRVAVEYDPNIFRIIEMVLLTFSIRSTYWSAPPYPTRKQKEPTRAL